ncbi:MAG: hypothetical protein HOP11_12400 [Saprospiraceae bacterium]|nr:hypothetical protein [Saprospiraceae bacterium]
MKIINLILILFIISCNTKNNSVVNVPELLDRPEKLQYSIEWPRIKNTYADLKYKLKKEPESIESLISLSNLFIGEARVTGEHGHYYNAGLQMIDHALQIKKISKDNQFLALSNKASIQLSLHDFANALITAQKAVAINPYNSKIYGSIVDAYVELGDYEKAVENADKMVSIRPDLSSYSRVSYLREIHGMVDESIEAMKMAVEAGSPGSEERSWAVLQLGELYLRYNKVEESEYVLKQLLTERENYPFALGSLAEVYMKQNKLEHAEKTLQEACEIIPEVGFYVTLAELYKKQGRTEEMKTKLREILEMLKDDTDHGHNMSLEYAGLYLEFFDDAEMALKYIKSDQKMRPENIDINRMLAKIYIQKKDKSNAQICLQKAKITNSQHPEIKEIENQIQSI